jgi:hypothetical protein
VITIEYFGDKSFPFNILPRFREEGGRGSLFILFQNNHCKFNSLNGIPPAICGPDSAGEVENRLGRLAKW